ncbi:beta-amyrin 28-monooxygenase-like [Mangifera indica]|uniref:beta-amyrin 28-monooxygenase-like n=1 Tax=Mangifera indica TaxID=29780 RepID=UPI001CF98D41|nr:beta-amyrin 28-monooxygenase-like [Mangifera indica]
MDLISTPFFMEFSYLFLFYLAPLLILASGIRSLKTRHKNLPPGSFGLPFIGETIQFRHQEKFVLDRMKKYSPDIFKTKILGDEVAVICGPDGHKFIFSNENKLFTPILPYSMQKILFSNSPSSEIKKELKTVKTLPGFLKTEDLARCIGIMDSITQQQMRTFWEDHSEVKAFPLAKSLTLWIACRLFMGTDDPGIVARTVARLDDVKVGMFSAPLNFPGTNFHKACKAAAAIHGELLRIISEKKAAMARGALTTLDCLSHLILATDESRQRMSEVEIADRLLGLLVVGYGTVATVMTLFMKYVGERPDVYNQVLKEQQEIAACKKPEELLNRDDIQKMKYSWYALCEVMRVKPAIQGTIIREVLTEFTYAGYTVPKGWKVYWNVNSTNKNPKYFPNPENFDPSRHDETSNLPLFTFVPFGGGPRMCPGKEYARLVTLTFVHNLVKRFRWEMVLPKERIVGDTMPFPEEGLPTRLYHH